MMTEEIRITSQEDLECRAFSTAGDCSNPGRVCLRIEFHCLNWQGRQIRSADLAALITNESHRLEGLILDGVRVVGDFVNVADALSKCRHLKILDLFSCRLSTNNLAGPLQGLGDTLPKVPLVHLCLSFSLTPRQTPWSILTPLLKNPHHALQILHVNGFDAPTIEDDSGNEQVRGFFANCAASQTLQQFTCLPHSTCSFTNPVMGALEDLIQSTSSIKELRVSLDKGTDLEGIAKALRDNQTIQTLELQGPHRPLSVAVWKAFYKTLEHYNFTLTQLQMKILLVETICSTFRQKKFTLNWQQMSFLELVDIVHAQKAQATMKGIQFFLSLNRIGRTKLLTFPSSSTKRWLVDTIAGLEDVSATFYLLKELNAFLFSGSGA